MIIIKQFSYNIDIWKIVSTSAMLFIKLYIAYYTRVTPTEILNYYYWNRAYLFFTSKWTTIKTWMPIHRQLNKYNLYIFAAKDWALLASAVSRNSEFYTTYETVFFKLFDRTTLYNYIIITFYFSIMIQCWFYRSFFNTRIYMIQCQRSDMQDLRFQTLITSYFCKDLFFLRII